MVFERFVAVAGDLLGATRCPLPAARSGRPEAGSGKRAAGRLLLTALATLALTAPAAAQSAGDGFLFRSPLASVNVRGGFAHASAGSEIFSFSAEQFTLGRGDFSSPSAEAELQLKLLPRVEVVLGTAYMGTEIRSEYRDWEDNDDRPIEQTTTFVRVPATASLKAYLVSPGESIGQFAWIPARVAPYVGAGAGGMWYRFRQSGDFINMSSLVVSADELTSDGWTRTAHAFAGLDYSLTPRLALTGEARYTWGETELDQLVYEGFDPIDLSGVSASVGIHLRLF